MAEFPKVKFKIVARVFIAQQAAVVCSVMGSNTIHPAKLCTVYHTVLSIRYSNIENRHIVAVTFGHYNTILFEAFLQMLSRFSRI